MNIILHQPEIPSNTGNIGRTCVATGSSLHLIEPLGFILSDKLLKRAGMDYWDKLDLTRYMNYDQFREKHPGAKVWMATTKGGKSYTDVRYSPDDYIMFGRESGGIPEEILFANWENCIRIPMGHGIRSLNLANSVAIVLYEALRQNDFPELEREKGGIMKYQFYGWENANIPAVSDEFKGIDTPLDLYDALSHIWKADTCAPRMRADWTEENKTYGQCSITAFLAQDIFGGKVFGVLRPGGNYHCYNVIGEAVFDLTSEQFGNEVLDYEDNPEQFRDVHFSKKEKKERYELLRSRLREYCLYGADG